MTLNTIISVAIIGPSLHSPLLIIHEESSLLSFFSFLFPFLSASWEQRRCVATLPNVRPNKQRRKKTNDRESNHLSLHIVVWGTSPPSSGRLGSPKTKCCLSLGHRTGSGTPWHLICHSQGKTIPVPHVPQYCQSATEYTCSMKSIIRF